MNCKLENGKPDWKAYVLGEMDAAARRGAEQHAESCGACQEECAELRLTLNAMATLREEEVPRRIAFVSDKVFEPRWWHVFWGPSMGKRPAYAAWAAAGLIAGAILLHGFMRPAGSFVNATNITANTAAMEAQIEAQVASRVTADVTKKLQAQMAEQMQAAVASAVKQAVAETRREDDRRTAALLQSTDRRYLETAEFLNKQVSRIYAMNSGAGVR